MRQVFVVLAMLCIAAWLVGCGSGSSPTSNTGTLSGMVYLGPAPGKALPTKGTRAAVGTAANGATITVSGYPSLTTKSSATGAFQLAKVPLGSQVLEVSCPGYANASYPITVQQGTNPAQTLYTGAPATSSGQWTVLVYMAANNSLDSDAVLNFQQMEQAVTAGTNNPVTILVQMTRAGGYGTGTDNWSGTRRYVAQQNTSSTVFLPAELVSNMGSSVDSGNPQTLQQFVTWGESYAPAKHYLVDVWDHGSGWDPVNDAVSKATSRAVCYDQTTGSVMTDASLSTALTAASPIDIVAMDDCLMSCAEVAYQIRNQANYLVASEDSEPAAGFNYTDIVTKLESSAGSITPVAFAQYLASDSLGYWGSGPYTMSALDLTKMDAVASALNAFSTRLIAVNTSANSAALLTSWQNCPAFDATDGSNMKDLTQYATQVAAHVNDSQLQADAQQLNLAIANSVVWCGKASGDPQAAGLSIYSPAGSIFNSTPGAITSYAALALAGSTSWEQWLEASPGH